MGYVLKAVLSSAQHPEYGQIIAMIFASRRCTDRNTLW